MILETKILLKIDWKILNQYIDNNLIIANKHPEYNIWILNYSPKVQSKRIWDDYTIACRGMIIDEEGNILARPFKKFKNIEEYHPSEIDFNQDFDAFEKMDGSLIIIFYYSKYKEWIIASRGSFMSDQVIEARKIIKDDSFEIMDKKCTYLFEILYAENRIVVDYGETRDLVLLGRIETLNGFEMFYDDMLKKYSKHFTIVKKIKVKSFDELLKLREKNDKNREGFVVRFENGFRIKLKFEEYVRLHGILTNVSNLTIWEHLMNGYDFDELIDRVPDEFYNWLNKTKLKLQIEFNEIERNALKRFVEIYYNLEITDRKEFAEEAKKFKYPSILFQLFDKKGYDKIIWKSIRPQYSKPFSDDY